MSREVYVMRNGQLVPKAVAYGAPAEGVAPGIISDSFKEGALWHPITGQMIDSKSHFRRVTRDHGGEEVGTEVQKDRRQYIDGDARHYRDAAGRALNMLKNGYRPTVLPERYE